MMLRLQFNNRVALSSWNRHYSKYYDSESAAVVMEKLKAEIELFGYTYS